MKDLAAYIHAIPDFPKPGIVFRDITGILDSADGLRLAGHAVDALVSYPGK